MCLDHFHSSLSDLGDGFWDVHHLLFLYLLQDVVNGNECTCLTHTSTVQWVYVTVTYVTCFDSLSHLQCTTIGPLDGWC